MICSPRWTRLANKGPTLRGGETGWPRSDVHKVRFSRTRKTLRNLSARLRIARVVFYAMGLLMLTPPRVQPGMLQLRTRCIARRFGPLQTAALAPGHIHRSGNTKSAGKTSRRSGAPIVALSVRIYRRAVRCSYGSAQRPLGLDRGGGASSGGADCDWCTLSASGCPSAPVLTPGDQLDSGCAASRGKQSVANLYK
jgi:hypothetical protein